MMWILKSLHEAEEKVPSSSSLLLSPGPLHRVPRRNKSTGFRACALATRAPWDRCRGFHRWLTQDTGGLREGALSGFRARMCGIIVDTNMAATGIHVNYVIRGWLHFSVHAWSKRSRKKGIPDVYFVVSLVVIIVHMNTFPLVTMIAFLTKTILDNNSLYSVYARLVLDYPKALIRPTVWVFSFSQRRNALVKRQ